MKSYLKQELIVAFNYLNSKYTINEIRKRFNKNSNKLFKLSNKKLFCILEQGADKNNDLSYKKNSIFNTNFSDFYRLNWKGDEEDKLASFYAKDISWSQGRSLLYEKTKGKYDFYIFIDDDISIDVANKEDVAIKIRNDLLKYQPLHGSIINNTWPKIKTKKKNKIIGMKGGDLCVQIFRSDFAKTIFPTWLHGSGKSMWYAQFIAHIISPQSSIYLNDLTAKNTRTEEHCDINLSSYNNQDTVSKFFEEKILEKKLKKLFKLWFEYSNSRIISNKCYSSQDLKICPFFERKALNYLLNMN